MRIFSLFFLSLFLLPLISRAAAADASSVMAEIDSKIAQGKREFRSCGKFKKKFKKIVPGGLTIESPSHLNKKQALAYLEILEKYPDHAKGFDEATELYRKNVELLLAETAQVDHFKRVSAIQGECAVYSILVHATLLFRDVKVFSFNQKERAKVEKFARGYLRQAGVFENVGAANAKGKVLEAYLENLYEGADKEKLLARVQNYLKEIEARRDARLELSNRLRAEGKGRSLEYWRGEWEMARAAEKSYGELAKSVAF